MNGAVFHVSAMMTASFACHPSVAHRTWVPRMELAMPLASKIQAQSLAETTVGMAHGTRMLARMSPLPLNALFMIKAIATPMTISMTTQTTVKNVVLKNAFQNRDPVSPLKIAV